jgi:hypothetical protein
VVARIGAVAAILVAVIGAACSSDSKLPQTNGVVDPCAMLTKAEVEAQFKVKVEAVDVRRDNPAAGSRECAWGWFVNGQRHSVTLLVVRPDKATDPEKRKRTAKQFLELDVGAANSQKIDHLGDGAVAIGDGIEFVRGDIIVFIRYVQQEKKQQTLSQQEGQSVLNLCVLANKRI